MDGFFDMLFGLIKALAEMLGAIFTGLLEAIGTGTAPNWWPTLHTTLKQSGLWVLIAVGIASVFFMVFLVLEKKREWNPMPRSIYKITLGIGALGAYLYFLGAWGLIPPIAICVLVVWLFTKIIKPHK